MRGLLATALLASACFDFDALRRTPDAAPPDLAVADLSDGDLGPDAGGDLATSPDLAGDDAGAGSKCGDPTLDFCDGFESGSTSQWSVFAMPPKAVVAVDVPGYRGQHALRTHLEGVASDYLRAVISRALPASPAHIRFFTRLPSSRTEVGLARLRETGGGDLYLKTNGAGQLGLIGPGFMNYTAQTVSRDAWHCVELIVDSQVRLFYDGAELTAAAHTLPGGATLTMINIGAEIGLDATAAFDVLFDEIAMDGQPVGCDK